MTNIHEIHIEGWMPYDVVLRGSSELHYWMALTANPVWGYHIRYGRTKTTPVIETGGKYTYYQFKMTGMEALSSSGIISMIKEFVNAGCEITKANIRDYEERERFYSILEDI